MDNKVLCERALAWAAEDVDLEDAAQLRGWVSQGEMSALQACMAGPLPFGTAGLRGIIGPGSHAINRSVVRKASLGLARYLKKQVEGAQTRGVVVGRDVRNKSEVFAAEAAGVFLAEGFRVFFWEEPCPTPLVPFAVLQVGAAAGVMVTASHNPAAYNGYKIYGENGAQITPPHERGIAEEISHTGPAKDIAVEALGMAGERCTSLGASMKEAYLKKALELCIWKKPAPLKVAYTAMHGVGTPWVEALLQKAGYEAMHKVEPQCTPDATFPTVCSPNPEEPSALALAKQLAETCQAQLLLANDPDADRLAVGARNAQGKLHIFSGNELGVLLGHYLLTRKEWRRPLLLSTVVSSVLFRRMCEALGARHEETLTGFKWIANRALELRRQGAWEFVFGFEEAIGYGAGDAVYDKDGISMALLVLDMASFCAAQGTTLVGYLEQIFRRFGFYTSRQKNLNFAGGGAAEKMLALMEALRNNPPRKLGGLNVVSRSDYQRGFSMTGSESKQLELPPSNVLAFVLEQGHRILIRPSGTEPKIKIYMEWCEVLREGEPLERAAWRAEESLLCLEQDCLRQWVSP
ncbi:MAG: phospho-sugar mutase [Cystobacterineae bacterium]|nr:phospho-sugar mutase [Cystobacterineae bacterium]